MKVRAKRAWIKALRSGEYTQTTAMLCRGGADSKEMCCLGVLIDVTQDGEWEQGWSTWDQKGQAHWMYDGESGGLPEAVLKNVGLTDDEEDALIGLNDTQRKTFAEIADYIELNIPNG